MEHVYDWNTFQSVYRPATPTPTEQKRIYAVVQGETVLAAWGSGIEDETEWVGCSWKDLSRQDPHAELTLISWDEYERQAHTDRYLEQLQSLRQELLSRKEYRERKQLHFWISALRGVLSKVLPSSFAMVVGQEQSDRTEHSVLVVESGKIKGFYSPDFSNLGPDREKVLVERVRSIADRLHVPVQGVFMPQEVWESWIKSPTPWRAMFLSILKQDVQFAPLRWWLIPYVLVRAIALG